MNPNRWLEPSTWAGVAAAVGALGPLWLSPPVVAAVGTFCAAVAVVLRERGA